MPKAKPQFTSAHVDTFFRKLKDIRDIELLVFKAQAGFEQLLFTAVAARLNVPTDELPPRLQFKTLADLALVGSKQPQFNAILEKFAALRNAMAHEMDPDPRTTSHLLEDFVETTHRWANAECEKQESLRKAREAGWIISDWGERDDVTVARRIRGAIGIVFSHLVQTCREMVYLSRDAAVPPTGEAQE